MRLIIYFALLLALLGFGLMESVHADEGDYPLNIASFLGDGGDADDVRAAQILSDGTVVLAANIGSAQPGGLTPLLLNNASETSSAAILRFDATGQTLLSVTRVGQQVNDMSVDGDDNLRVALWDEGFISLNATASALNWAQTPGRVLRVDAGLNGDSVALVTTSTDPDDSAPGVGTTLVYDAQGQEVGQFAGYRNTLDVCLDSASQTVVQIGWRQTTAAGNPVQIAYLRGLDYQGAVKYLAYDWSNDPNSERYLNAPENNMADTRGYRCDVGDDGQLYAAYEVAGGNHIFRYSPYDINTKVALVGGDQWHEFYNTRSEHKTVFARYAPDTGAYALGQQFTNRLSNGNGNTVRVRGGNITADAQGRVYLGGESAAGLPIPPQYTPKTGEVAYNPLGEDSYRGGAWFMVMSADFSTRLYVTRLSTGGTTRALDARIFEDDTANIVFAGSTTKSQPSETYTRNPLQGSFAGGDQDGFFGIIGDAVGPQAKFSTAQLTADDPLTLRFDAASSQGDITHYAWDFGDSTSGAGQIITHSYASAGAYRVTLTVTDALTRTDQQVQTIIAGGQRVYLPVILR